MKFIKTICFILLFCLIFRQVQKAFIPKWEYPGYDQETARVHEYKDAEEESVQVIFAGTSHSSYGINPMQLYHERKICSYNLGTNAIRISSAYYFLKKALQFQHPQILMFDVSTLYLNSFSNGTWRVSLDSGFRGPVPDEAAAAQYAKEYTENKQKLKEQEEEREDTLSNSDVEEEADSNREQEQSRSGLKTDTEKVGLKQMSLNMNAIFNAELSVLVPLYNYHDRWTELTSEDFFNEGGHAYFAKGYFYTTSVGSGGTTVENLNLVAESLSEERFYPETRITNDKRRIVYQEGDLYPSEPSEESLKWLVKINELCKDHDVELCLMKVPVMTSYKIYHSSWTKLRSECMHKIAKELGVTFCDLMYDVNLGIEQTDYCDDGRHLNYYGATKITRYLGNYLQNVVGLKRQSVGSYDAILPIYKQLDKIAEQHSCSEWDTYIDYLRRHMTRRTVLLAVKGTLNGRFREEEVQLLRKLGLDVPSSKRFGEDAYIAILQNGKRIYEASSAYPVEQTMTLDDDVEVTLGSVGIYNTSQYVQKASIQIDGTEYCLNGRGVNIIVFDQAMKCVVDRVNFFKTSSDEELVCERNRARASADACAYEYKLFDYYRDHIL